MEYFTRDVRGVWVCIWYETCTEEHAVWIANVVTEDQVVSLDGLATLGSGPVVTEIVHSVDRALQWARASNKVPEFAISLAGQFALRPGINEEVDLSIPTASVVEA